MVLFRTTILAESLAQQLPCVSKEVSKAVTILVRKQGGGFASILTLHVSPCAKPSQQRASTARQNRV